VKKNPQIRPPTRQIAAMVQTHGSTAAETVMNLRGFAYSQSDAMARF
jgi:hypothetical protein